MVQGGTPTRVVQGGIYTRVGSLHPYHGGIPASQPPWVHPPPNHPGYTRLPKPTFKTETKDLQNPLKDTRMVNDSGGFHSFDRFGYSRVSHYSRVPLLSACYNYQLLIRKSGTMGPGPGGREGGLMLLKGGS